MNDPSPVAPLALNGISKHFMGLQVLEGLSLRVAPGESVGLCGTSGAGKTVLLKIAATLMPINEGELRLFGDAPPMGNREALKAMRARIGMQFQNLGLFAFLDVYENVAFSLRKIGMPDAAIRERALPILDDLGLGRALEHYPDEISGGMKRRLAIARVLAKQPSLALFDDPTAGLDPLTAERVLTQLTDWGQTHDASLLIASPDPEVLERVVDRVLLLKDGALEPLP
jgi:ABC-type transporter Mla maintaining outer membrane lipid asymmetry ATPase subunit MlaF